LACHVGFGENIFLRRAPVRQLHIHHNLVIGRANQAVLVLVVALELTGEFGDRHRATFGPRRGGRALAVAADRGRRNVNTAGSLPAHDGAGDRRAGRRRQQVCAAEGARTAAPENFKQVRKARWP